MATRKSYRCPICKDIQEIVTTFFGEDIPVCEKDQIGMTRYFGDLRSDQIMVNFGYRENRYETVESANIAKYQFTNL